MMRTLGLALHSTVYSSYANLNPRSISLDINSRTGNTNKINRVNYASYS